jgi:Tol biopolymer transport system component
MRSVGAAMGIASCLWSVGAAVGSPAPRGPRADTAGAQGTLACNDRRYRLTLFRGNGHLRRRLKLKGENPIISPDGRLIAYRNVRYRLHDYEVHPVLYVTDLEGRHARAIVSLPATLLYGSEPPSFDPLSWSSDSSRLAYVRATPAPGSTDASETRNRLFVASVSGGEQAVAIHREGVAASEDEARQWVLSNAVAFSPDGGKIAVAGVSPDRQRGVWLVDVATGTARLLHPLPGIADIFQLAWSPDGAHLAVSEAGAGFIVLDAAGGASSAKGFIGTGTMRWSRDSRRLALDGGSARSPYEDTRVIDAAGDHLIDPTPPVSPKFGEEHQLLSPDGRLVAFDREYFGGGSLKRYAREAKRSGTFVVPANGGKPRKLIASSPPPAGRIRNRFVCTDWGPR